MNQENIVPLVVAVLAGITLVVYLSIKITRWVLRVDEISDKLSSINDNLKSIKNSINNDQLLK